MGFARHSSTSPRLPLLAPLLLLLAFAFHPASAQLVVSAITPSQTSDIDTPNTFIGTVGSEVASALLGVGTPAMLWGVVGSDSIIAACNYIVNTGNFTLTVTVSDNWGDTEGLALQLLATGGCLAESDASGTQFLFTDDYARKSAIVCPSNAGTTGCAIYMTGDDVTELYEDFQNGIGSMRKVLGTRKLLGCDPGTIKQATVVGVTTSIGCAVFGPVFGWFCAAGVVGVHVAAGVASACAGTGCFPGDAIVQTPQGTLKHMSEIEVGDRVAVWGDSGTITYQDVYAFGHKDALATAFFVEITVDPFTSKETSLSASSDSNTIRLSALHFIPTSSADGMIIYKRAQDVQIADIVWATGVYNNNSKEVQALPFVVKAISTTWSHGLYNPLTMSGTILVDGVVASVHSDWFLDGMFDAMGLAHWLPFAYQSVLMPIRMLYFVVGKDIYTCIYNVLDAQLDVAKFGTNYGGLVTSFASIAATSLLMSVVIFNAQKSKIKKTA